MEDYVWVCHGGDVTRQDTSKVLMVDVAGSDLDERLHQSYSIYDKMYMRKATSLGSLKPKPRKIV